MADNKNMELGILLIFIAAFFLMSGMDLFQYQYRFLGDNTSTLIAFVFVALGVYWVAKGSK